MQGPKKRRKKRRERKKERRPFQTSHSEPKQVSSKLIVEQHSVQFWPPKMEHIPYKMGMLCSSLTFPSETIGPLEWKVCRKGRQGKEV